MARAFSSALASNVAPVSGTSGASGNSSSPMTWWSRIRASSRSLPSFLVARTRASADIEGQGLGLQLGQLGAAGDGEAEKLVEHGAAERLALGGALDLHEVAGRGADHVHVGVRRHVLLVTQVQAGLAVDDADADRGDRGEQRVALGPLAPLEPGHGVGQ